MYITVKCSNIMCSLITFGRQYKEIDNYDNNGLLMYRIKEN